MNHDVIIHIGYPKTGTTWFSNNFYPKVNGINFVKPESILSELLSENYLKLSEKFLLRKKSIIIDPEFAGVIRYQWNNGLYRKEIAEKLHILFPSAKIVIFIRNQIDFLASAYIYYIRKGGTLKPAEVFPSIIDTSFSVPLEYLEYDKTIRFYSDLFGENNVFTFLYEDFSVNNLSFIKNFISVLKLDINPESVSFVPRNEKLRKYLLRFMRFSNKFTKYEVTNKKYLIHIPGIFSLINNNYRFLNSLRIFGKKPVAEDVVDKEETELINNYFRKSNQILIDEFNLESVKKYNYPI